MAVGTPTGIASGSDTAPKRTIFAGRRPQPSYELLLRWPAQPGHLLRLLRDRALRPVARGHELELVGLADRLDHGERHRRIDPALRVVLRALEMFRRERAGGHGDLLLTHQLRL